MGKKTSKKTMTEEEKIAWDILYSYVRKNILGYDENQALSSQMVLRLKGLLVNKFMENNNIKDTANYSYEVILNTFKYCSPQIMNALRTNNFRDERHKFNYVLKIVESNINTVYMKMKAAEKAKEETEKIDMIEIAEYVNTFKKKEKKNNSRLDDLW